MPKIISENCVACGSCADVCPQDAITVGDIAVIDHDKCVNCVACVDECNFDAIVDD